MKLGLPKAVRLVPAAFVSALVSLLVFGVSVAAAGAHYFHRSPVIIGNPSVTVVAIVFALVPGVELALIVFLARPRKRRAGSVQIESRHAEREPERTGRAKPPSCVGHYRIATQTHGLALRDALNSSW